MKGGWIYILVVGAALAIIVYAGISTIGSGVVLEGKVSPTGTAEGEILAIEEARAGGKEAVVRLASGEKVRAYVPGACPAFVGQIATLSEYPGGFYMLKDAKEKQQ
jgi:hypothetical protein